LFILGGAILTLSGCSPDGQKESTEPSFVGRQSCVDCHQAEADAFEGSHHDLAMQEATNETVLADFDGSSFQKGERTYTFFRENGSFYVRLESEHENSPERFKVAYTFGVTPLQQYLLEFPAGRLQSLTIAWNSRKNEWFSLYPDRSIPRDSWLHWTNQSQNWNSTCASCHSTNYRKNYDPKSDRYQPEWSEIDVSCESCHGPGSEHVAIAKNAENYEKTVQSSGDHGFPVQFTSGDVAFRTGSDGVPQRVNPDRKVSDAQLTECGRCHGRRSDLSKHHRHGDRFLDHFEPSLLRDGLYHADGQVLEEVYVYGSFRQSKMYQKGVRCTDCHNAHSGELKLEGNKVCTQCHGEEQYNTPEHHHHPPSSEGASCVNCHMTEKTFMQVDPRRDHKFHIPDPAVSDQIGSPDACTSCHTDKSKDWAAGHVENWSGDNSSSSNYGPMFDAAWNGDPEARSALVSFLQNKKEPDFLRASAATTLGQVFPGPGTRSNVRALLDADDPLLRQTGARLFATGRNRNRSSVSPDPLLPLLSDPVRGVRFAAARSLSTMGLSGLDDKQKKRVEELVGQIEAVLLTNQDTRGGLFSLGQFYAQQDQPEQAITYLRRAIRMDTKFLDARTTLAQLLSRQEQPAEAASVLRPVTRQERPPEMAQRTWNRAKGQVFFQLGLLNAGPLNNRSRARDHLERAVRLNPSNARAHFNLGLLYSKMGDVDQADRALNRARKLQPDNPRYLYTLVTVHRDHGQMEKAVDYARTLKNEFPNNPRFQRVFRIMKRQAR
jgi:predicted CXXCH cytochrome family protein